MCLAMVVVGGYQTQNNSDSTTPPAGRVALGTPIDTVLLTGAAC
jgi:hypothetical protein